MPRHKSGIKKNRGTVDSGAGRLRIIGGKWRSRQLPIIDQTGLRPTPDRVRETLFNWLQAIVPDARCLDLFAGSGALGFESASRGAAQVDMVELQDKTCRVLKQNVSLLGAGNIHVYQQDALQWLREPEDQDKLYDLVFLDPPYASDVLNECCHLLEQDHWLADEAYIYLELSSDNELGELPPNWQIIRGKKAGQVSYHLVERSKPDGD